MKQAWPPTRKWLWVHRIDPRLWLESYALPHVMARAFPLFVCLGEVSL